MARKAYSTSSSIFRYVQPRYYIKRPKRFALLILLFISLAWFVYDRQLFNREHEEDIFRLKQEVTRLRKTLEDIKGHMKDSGESIQKDEKINKFAKGISVEDDPVSIERREKVKDAMLHAWTAYEKYAWGKDELKPRTMNGVDSFGGLGATLVDSLDTLFIMGLDTQFKRAREWIAESLYFNKNIEVSVFETTIRLN